jgi:NAD(P)-dependent dehydrogenase (short-subunit alcohol dehydrogenase family)
MKNLFDLDNQVAAVVGGTGALGGAMALALATHGARVVVLGRNAENGAAKVAEIEAAGGVAIFQAADALDRGSLEDAQSEIMGRFGPVSILVNAAGGNRPDATLPPGADFTDLPLEGWNGVFDLNLVGGAFLPCQVFGKTMLSLGGGSIINVASLAGMKALSRVVAYGAAKAAVLNLTEFLAREWATKGIRVNAISPGFFPAEQNRKLLFNDDGSYSARAGQIIGHTPMERFGSSEELAGATVFLASKAASGFVTGHNLVVDGGFSATTI